VGLLWYLLGGTRSSLMTFSVCSNQEAARYLETYKMYENKNPDIIKERVKEDHFSKVMDTLTSVRSVNKTDVHNLLENFGVRFTVRKFDVYRQSKRS
jgi:hypothetical protein